MDSTSKEHQVFFNTLLCFFIYHGPYPLCFGRPSCASPLVALCFAFRPYPTDALRVSVQFPPFSRLPPPPSASPVLSSQMLFFILPLGPAPLWVLLFSPLISYGGPARVQASLVTAASSPLEGRFLNPLVPGLFSPSRPLGSCPFFLSDFGYSTSFRLKRSPDLFPRLDPVGLEQFFPGALSLGPPLLPLAVYGVQRNLPWPPCPVPPPVRDPALKWASCSELTDEKFSALRRFILSGPVRPSHLAFGAARFSWHSLPSILQVFFCLCCQSERGSSQRFFAHSNGARCPLRASGDSFHGEPLTCEPAGSFFSLMWVQGSATSLFGEPRTNFPSLCRKVPCPVQPQLVLFFGLYRRPAVGQA